MVISTLLGTIKYVGLLWNGKSADITLFRSELGEISFKNKKVHVDLGFYGLAAELKEGLLMIPHKKPKKKELNAEQKTENTKMSSVRVIVENALAGTKHFFICTIKNRFHKIKKIQENFDLCAGLSNFKGKKRKSLIII